ncbi:HalOD1 output domain-containing protein [Halorubrum sp. DTA98]|uniref:HalOD1 output domain-containing protein n=1 Tax=Halorubrum sp. DTA98 TaxID=3402163 RepID=UPI003AAEFE59
MFDAEIVEPSTAVVGAVATVAGNDPLDIEPLYSTVDPDALDALFDRRKPVVGDLHTRFTLDGYDVTLSSYGSVVVRPPNTDESADRDEE